jgi:hypothetical protein
VTEVAVSRLKNFTRFWIRNQSLNEIIYLFFIFYTTTASFADTVTAAGITFTFTVLNC